MQVRGNFILEVLSPAAFTASACACRVTSLNHKVLNDTMECESVIVAVLCQCFEVFHRLRCFFGEETHFYHAFGSVDHSDFFAFFGHLRLQIHIFCCRFCISFCICFTAASCCCEHQKSCQNQTDIFFHHCFPPACFFHLIHEKYCITRKKSVSICFS